MNCTDKLKKHTSKLFLLFTLFIAVIILCGVFTYKESEIIDTAFAANTPVFSIGTTMKYDSNDNSYNVTPPNTLNSSNMTGSSHITNTFASNILNISSAHNKHGEALYADISASVSIPAWYQYEIEYSFVLTFFKYGGMPASFCEFFDFGGDSVDGTNAGFQFGKAVGTTTSTQGNYLVASVSDPRIDPPFQDSASNPAPYTYKKSYTYKNTSNNAISKKNNFGTFVYCLITSDLDSHIGYTVKMSATVKETKLSATKPTADTHVYKYNGSNQTYVPNETLADKSKYQLASTSDSLTQMNVGTYTIRYELKDPTNAPWDGGDTNPVELTFEINKGDLDIGITYAGQGQQRFLSAGLPKVSDITLTGTNASVAGTFSWDPPSQTASVGSKQYDWKFTPTDTKNWNEKKGSETITFANASVKGIKVSVNNDPQVGNIYDRFNPDAYASFEDYIKSHLVVCMEYVDNSLGPALPASGYTVNTKQSGIMVTVGAGQEQKTISVSVPHTGGVYVNTVTADVYESTITGAMIVQKTPLAHTFVYPMTLDEIKDNYSMMLSWNFSSGTYFSADSKNVSVAVKPSTDNPSGVIQAGNIDLTFTFKDGNRTRSEDLIDTCVIDKGDYDISGVTMTDKSEQYDGNKKTITATGDIKDKKTGKVVTGVTITYSYEQNGSAVSTDGASAVGIYDVIASFTNPDTTNYNNITVTKIAKLTITNKSWNMTGVTFTGDTLTYDGNFHKIEIGGVPLPDPGITVTYKYEKGGVEITSATADGGVKDAGVYTVTAMFSNPDSTNYADIPNMTATLTINKANFDMSGITFADKTVTANGTSSFTIEISGSLPNPGIVVTYTVDGYAETSFMGEGIYAFTASFSNPDPANYNNIADMTATLTINANPNPTPEPNPSNGTNLWDRIVQAVENGFPLWQIATIAVGGLLSIIFLIKSIQYGNRRKKAKGEAKKISAKTYALLPVFDTAIVLAGLSNKVWSIIAFAVVGVTVLMFVIALVTRKGWKNAELAKEQALESAQESKELALQEKIAMIGTQSAGKSAGNVDIEEILRKQREEMEAHYREEMARRDEEIRRRDEEQAKRDEAMKLMLANMMGRQQGMDSDDMPYASMDNTDLLVQKVIAGLLPMVQQMVPEPTAYLSAPGSVDNDSINTLTSVLQQQNAQIADLQSKIDYMSHNVYDAEIIPDNSEEINALNSKIEELQRRLADSDTSVTNLDNSDEIRALKEEHSAQIAELKNQIAIMSSMSVDELDDEDFDDEEEWDSVLDEDDDDFVEAIIIEEDGKQRKVYPNFRMRLKQSSDKNREWYTAIKNLFCSQKGVTYRVYKRVEKIRYQGQVIAVIGIAKRSIKLWLALKPYEYDARRYHHKDVSDKPRFVDVPMYVRVTSDRALERSQELILALFQELNMEARKRYNDRSIQELIFTLKHNRLLTNKQNKQLLCETMHVHDCDVLDDELAEKCIEAKNVESLDESNIETVKLDDIDAKFQDGNRVTLDRLKKVGLVSEDCTGFTVTADKRLTKPLIIVANDFSLTAVKLIVLTGGRAIRLQTV